MTNRRPQYVLLLTILFLLAPLLLSAFNLPDADPTATLTASPTSTPTPSPTGDLVTLTPAGTLTPTGSETSTLTPTITGTIPSATPSETPTLTPTITLTPVPRLETSVSRTLAHKWSLANWSNNHIVCDIFLAGETDPPTHQEILDQCGVTVYWLWYNSAVCDQNAPRACTGVYLIDAGMADTTITTEYVRPIFVSMQISCDPVSVDGSEYCLTQPILVVNGLDTKNGAWVKSITIKGLSNQDTICQGSTCQVILPDNDSVPRLVTYWANSTLGDSSPRHTFAIEVTHRKTRPQFWQVSAAGDSLGDSPLAAKMALSAAWLSLPPVNLPAYLTNPDGPDSLSTQKDYYYLAGMLIREGYIEAGGCPSGGLEKGGITANECGLQLSKSRQTGWQNIFDPVIYDAGARYNLPPRILKNIFSRESQFFPGISRTEFGLGHITDNGADTLLMYDPDLFNQYCASALRADACRLGYMGLEAQDQAIVRGLVLKDADAYCGSCQYHINNAKANASIGLFARLLIASGRQVGRVIEINKNMKPGQIFSYEDLWRFTLLAYNAGAGCFEQALLAHPNDKPMTWESIKGYASIGCMNGVYYAESIAVP